MIMKLINYLIKLKKFKMSKMSSSQRNFDENLDHDFDRPDFYNSNFDLLNLDIMKFVSQKSNIRKKIC